MKKFFQLGAIFAGLLMTQYGYTQNSVCCDPQPTQCVPQPDTECDEQYKLFCHQEPRYYNDWKCVEEQVSCTKKCCRQVPQYYQVAKCRQVPQYYNETLCRYVPEYYDVPETKCVKKWVCEKKCVMCPKYYWKHTRDTNAQYARPSSSCPAPCEPSCEMSGYGAARPSTNWSHSEKTRDGDRGMDSSTQGNYNYARPGYNAGGMDSSTQGSSSYAKPGYNAGGMDSSTQGGSSYAKPGYNAGGVNSNMNQTTNPAIQAR